MTQAKKKTRAAGVMVLAASCFTAFAADPPVPANLPFTLSAETTRITAPLKPDGSPDYIAAINEKLGKGVTPENNGFAFLLAAMGTRVEDGNIAARQHDPLLKLLGISDNAPDQPIFQSDTDFWKAQHLPDNLIQSLDNHLNDLRRTLWHAADEAVIAAYLQSQKPFLDALDQAAARPRWWLPAVSTDGNMVSILLPSLGRIRNMGVAVAVRANGRFADGDFDGFLADVLALKRLSRHLESSFTLIEALVGYANEATADSAIAAAADSGKLTEPQCQAILKMLEGLPPRTPMTVELDTFERWTLLDVTVLTAMGKNDQVLSILGDQDDAATQFASVDRSRVDWDIALRQTNAAYDEQVALIMSPDIATLKIKAQAFTDKQTHIHDAMRSTNLKPRENESRDAYSRRVADAIGSALIPSVDRAHILEWRTQMSEGMARMLVAAAAVKAGTGKWPAHADELPSARFPDLPRDIYSAQGRGTEPLKMTMTEYGPRAYSVGENMRDDGGVRGDGGRDDFYLGGEGPPATAATPAAPMRPAAPLDGLP